MRVLPPPTLNNVPDAHPPPSCMPRPKMNAPTATPTAHRRNRTAHRLSPHGTGGNQWKEHRAGQRQHQHLRAQAGAPAIRDEHPPRRGEAERSVIQNDTRCRADDEQRCLPPADGGVEIPGGKRNDRCGDRRRPRHERAGFNCNGSSRVHHLCRHGWPCLSRRFYHDGSITAVQSRRFNHDGSITTVRSRRCYHGVLPRRFPHDRSITMVMPHARTFVIEPP